MSMHERHIRAKHHLRMCLQYMEGKNSKDESNEGDDDERRKKKGKAKNNPFAIANAAQKKSGMSDEKKESLVMRLKKKYGEK